MKTKTRPLEILRILREKTDPTHFISTPELMRELEEKGIVFQVRTLRTDIRALQAAGYNIEIREAPSEPTLYAYCGQEWEPSELRILIDAVSTASFLSVRRTKQIVGKLTSLGGVTEKDTLKPRVFVSERLKPRTSTVLYNILTIDQAIREGKTISFQIENLDTSMNRVLRKDGKRYEISPYATVWKNERYYVVGWSEEHGEIRQFRVDRMHSPRMTKKDAVPEDENFNIRDYADAIFKMYGSSDIKEVTLRCRENLVDNIVDHFGEGVSLFNIGDGFFDVTVRVCPGSTFYGWVFQYAGDMEIISPKEVVREYRARLRTAGGELKKGE